MCAMTNSHSSMACKVWKGFTRSIRTMGELVLKYQIMGVSDNANDELVFETPGGELSVCKQGELLAMNFPTATTQPQVSTVRGSSFRSFSLRQLI